MDSCTFKKIPSLMDFSRFPKYCTSIMNDISPFSVKKNSPILGCFRIRHFSDSVEDSNKTKMAMNIICKM